jgi:hypothetical protein
MDRVDPRTQTCKVEVFYTEGSEKLEDIVGDGFTFGTANPRDIYYTPSLPTVAKGDRAYMVDVYEHGGVAYTLSGEGMQCQFDTSPAGAFLILHADAGWNMDADAALEIARSLLKAITAWANGHVFGYVITDLTGEEVDSCWGILDVGDDLAEMIRDSVGSLIIAENNDLAESFGLYKEIN